MTREPPVPFGNVRSIEQHVKRRRDYLQRLRAVNAALSTTAIESLVASLPPVDLDHADEIERCYLHNRGLIVHAMADIWRLATRLRQHGQANLADDLIAIRVRLSEVL